MWPYTTQERNWLGAAGDLVAETPLAVPAQQTLPFADACPNATNDNGPYDPMIFVCK